MNFQGSMIGLNYTPNYCWPMAFSFDDALKEKKKEKKRVTIHTVLSRIKIHPSPGCLAIRYAKMCSFAEDTHGLLLNRGHSCAS